MTSRGETTFKYLAITDDEGREPDDPAYKRAFDPGVTVAVVNSTNFDFLFTEDLTFGPATKEWRVARAYMTTAPDGPLTVPERAIPISLGVLPSWIDAGGRLTIAAPDPPELTGWRTLCAVFPKSKKHWWVRWTSPDGLYYWLDPATMEWVGEPAQKHIVGFATEAQARRRLHNAPPPPGVAIEIGYTNYRGEFSKRRIVPEKVWFGSNEWHRDLQWFVDALDVDKGAVRTFALWDIDWPALPGDRPVKVG